MNASTIQNVNARKNINNFICIILFKKLGEITFDILIY